MKILSIILVLIAFVVTAKFWDDAQSAIHQVLAVAVGSFILILSRLAQASTIQDLFTKSDRPQLPPKES